MDNFPCKVLLLVDFFRGGGGSKTLFKTLSKTKGEHRPMSAIALFLSLVGIAGLKKITLAASRTR